MWERLKKILEERNKLATQMREMHATAEKEERGFTADEKEQWAKMTKRVNELVEEEQRVREMMEADAGLDDIANALPGDTRDGGPDGGSGADDGGDSEDDADDYDSAFRAMLRSTEPGLSGLTGEQRTLLGQRLITPEEVRAMGVSTPAGGGYQVPEGFGDRMIETQLAFGGILPHVEIIDTASGNDLPFPSNDDTGNEGEIVGENSANNEQDLVMAQVLLQAYMFGSRMVRVSYQLMQDSAFDLDAWLARKLGERIGRRAARAFGTGTGTNEPQGITVGAGAGHTAAAAAAIGFPDLTGLEHSVDPAYRAMGAKFAFNDSTLQLLQETSDSEGRPLWLPAVAGAVPATIYGYEYAIDQSFPNVATGNRSVVFGDLKQYYVRRVTDIALLRLVERYAEFFQVAFLAFQRMDGRVMDSDAIKALTHP